MKIYVVTNYTSSGNHIHTLCTSKSSAKKWMNYLSANIIRDYFPELELADMADDEVVEWVISNKKLPKQVASDENSFLISLTAHSYIKIEITEKELTDEQLKEAERNTLNEYFECVQDFNTDFWKDPEHFKMYQESIREQLDRCDADRYVHLSHVLGINVGMENFRKIDADMWNGIGGSLDILDIDREKKNEEWQVLKEILKDENIEVLKLSMDEAYEEIDDFRDKLGEMFLDIFNEVDNNTLEMAKGIIAAFEKCETQRDYDIANTMLRGICGYGLDHIIEEIRKRDAEGFVWEIV